MFCITLLGKGKALAGALEQEVETNKTEQNQSTPGSNCDCRIPVPHGSSSLLCNRFNKEKWQDPKRAVNNLRPQSRFPACYLPVHISFSHVLSVWNISLSLLIKIPLILTLRPPGWNEMSLHTLGYQLEYLFHSISYYTSPPFNYNYRL